MALIIETGAGIANADSYVSLSEFRAFATARGYTVPVADGGCESLLRKSIDYIESLRDNFKGSKLYGEGYLQWPRTDVEIDGFIVLETEIPSTLKNAQM